MTFVPDQVVCVCHGSSDHLIVCVQSTGKRLPEWGFQQYEVVTDRTSEGLQSIWTVDELTVPKPHPSANESRVEEERQIKEQFLQDKQPVSFNNSERQGSSQQLTFWEKYFEMQVRKVQVLK